MGRYSKDVPAQVIFQQEINETYTTLLEYNNIQYISYDHILYDYCSHVKFVPCQLTIIYYENGIVNFNLTPLIIIDFNKK